MVGYVQKAIAEALSSWDTLANAHMIPIRATDTVSVVVNSPLPVVAIQINGEDGRGNTYIGGGIRQYFELILHCIFELQNYSFSPDKNVQNDTLDLSDDVIRCMERSQVLNAIRLRHDFNATFDRMETETTYGTSGSVSIPVEVHRVVYKCDVEFDPGFDMEKEFAYLKKIIIDNGVNKSIIE